MLFMNCCKVPICASVMRFKERLSYMYWVFLMMDHSEVRRAYRQAGLGLLEFRQPRVQDLQAVLFSSFCSSR